MLVADLAGWNQHRSASPLGHNAFDGLFTEGLGLHVLIPPGVCHGPSISAGFRRLPAAVSTPAAHRNRSTVPTLTAGPSTAARRGLGGRALRQVHRVVDTADRVVDESDLREAGIWGQAVQIVQRLLAPRSAVGIAVKLHGVGLLDPIAIRQRLRGLSDDFG